MGDDEIRVIMESHDDLELAAEILVDAAHEAGSTDDISVCLAEVAVED